MRFIETRGNDGKHPSYVGFSDPLSHASYGVSIYRNHYRESTGVSGTPLMQSYKTLARNLLGARSMNRIEKLGLRGCCTESIKLYWF